MYISQQNFQYLKTVLPIYDTALKYVSSPKNSLVSEEVILLQSDCYLKLFAATLAMK